MSVAKATGKVVAFNGILSEHPLDKRSIHTLFAQPHSHGEKPGFISNVQEGIVIANGCVVVLNRFDKNMH